MMAKSKLDDAVDESSADHEIVYLTQLYITCEKSGGLHLVELGLMAVRLSVYPSIRQTMWARLKILKAAVDQNIRFSSLFRQGTAFFQQL